MLLEAILKYSERAGLTEEATAIQSAFRVMQTTPKAANEMMDVGRLQGFEVRSKVVVMKSPRDIIFFLILYSMDLITFHHSNHRVKLRHKENYYIVALCMHSILS